MVTTVRSTISNTVTADYSTVQAWEDAAPANLVTADIIWEGVIVAPDAFSTEASAVLTIAGSTSDATRFKRLTVAPGMSFADHSHPVLRFDATKGASMVTTTGAPILVQESYAQILRVQCFSTTAANQIGISAGVTGVLIDKVIGETSGNNGAFEGINNTIANTLFINRKAGATLLTGSNVSGAITNYINCTFVVPSDVTAATNALWTATGTTANLTNCALFNCSSSAIGVGPGTRNFTTCAADRSTPPAGVTNISFVNAGFISGTNAASDFRIGSGSSLKDIGTTSATYASTDIFGKSRPYGSSYDIGCHEYAIYPADGLAYSHSINRRRRRHL